MGETAKNVYEVHVAGLPLKLRSSHDPQTVSELVKIVDQKVKEAMSANATVSFQNALVLAALNVSEELMLLKQTLAGELSRVEDRTRQILDRIEEATTAANS